jgi:alanyl-tRNA synthetase
VKNAFDQNPASLFYVGIVNRSGNTKALSQAISHVKGLSDRAALLISVDGQKVTHQCIIPKSLVEKGFKAGDWAQVVADKVGGKRGGNDFSAQGAGSDVKAVDEALKLAHEFASRMNL